MGAPDSATATAGEAHADSTVASLGAVAQVLLPPLLLLLALGLVVTGCCAARKHHQRVGRCRGRARAATWRPRTARIASDQEGTSDPTGEVQVASRTRRGPRRAGKTVRQSWFEKVSVQARALAQEEIGEEEEEVMVL